MERETSTIEFEETAAEKRRKVIKGFPELWWRGKRPFKFTNYFPAQLKETYGEPDDESGWINKIFWGDNLQVMSHLLKKFRGKIDLVYIDPPFDSKENYVKTIRVRNAKISTDSSSFEEKQYGDLWTNDEYLQFMYERLILIRELLSDTGSIFLHCDWHKVHHLRMIMDDIFGVENFKDEIVWHYRTGNLTYQHFQRKHDSILFYGKSGAKTYFCQQVIKEYYCEIYGPAMKLSMKGPNDFSDKYGDYKISQMDDVWNISSVFTLSDEHNGYPTQKPEALLERIIRSTTKPGDIVFDCFMGSGTTQAVAMKLGRRFLGADINLGAIRTTTKRLIELGKKVSDKSFDSSKTMDTYKESISEDEYEARMKLKKCTDTPDESKKYTSFEVYNVNNYDFFRNPIEAKGLIIDALEIQAFPEGNLWDGELNGRMVKVMPVNRIATKADLAEMIHNMPYKEYDKRKAENPKVPVESITIVCMGHEPDLKAGLVQELSQYLLDVEVLDILHDKKDLQLKREAEAEIVREGSKLVIREFYPMNLMQKLSLQKDYFVDDWRQLVDTIMIDWNYDGVVMQPTVMDIPDKKSLVTGVYDIPENAGIIRVKITDLLSESLEMEV